MSAPVKIINKSQQLYLILSTGFAMFSMFFGAGNLVFPLSIGQASGEHYLFATAGLIITGVLVPFLGLLGIIHFNGDSDKFFSRIGKVPGRILAFLILCLLGPFGVIPRCINVAYGSFALLFPEVTLEMFSLISCLIILTMALDKSKLVTILGMILTPVLLISLSIIIGKGLTSQVMPQASVHTPTSAFTHGLLIGYQIMDLLAAFFFGAVIVKHVRQSINEGQVIKVTNYACLVGVTLLTLVYIGFVYMGSKYAGILNNVSQEQYLGTIANYILGSYAGPIVCTAAIMACLTTSLVLASIFTDFVRNKITGPKINFFSVMCVTLVISFLLSTLKFSGIAAFLGPIVQTAYPGLILLTLLNIAYKKYDLQIVALPVYATFVGYACYTISKNFC